MKAEIEKPLSKAYENFLMRDLTYVMAGIIIIISIKYAYNINIINYDYFQISENLYRLIILLIIAYFVGLITKEALVAKYHDTQYWLKTPTPDIEGYGKNGYLRFMKEVQIEYRTATIRRLERVVYFFHIAASIGIASFISFLLLATSLLINYIPQLQIYVSKESSLITIKPSFDTIILTIFMFLVFINCINQNNKKWKEYNDFLKDLNKEMQGYYSI